ncbi:hypothetical protein EZS27_010478 [termite gut metagenome]|uniref:Methyltransferase type 11 domain-containing protein n=1 Tax=termite gut metagenome TaxID=433724 RepID=A0A5J4S7B6_9ZZZZ
MIKQVIKKILPNTVIRILRMLIRRFKTFFHKGERYVCPFCNYSSKDLSPIGIDNFILKEKQIIGGGKRLGGCYKCGSSDRERLIYIYLKEKMRLFSDKNKSILHIAPESLLSKKLLEFNFSEYVCGDLFPEGYSNYVKKIDILDIPYIDNTFDLIICNHVLEHIINDLDAMKELRRVLKLGGQAILQVPISKNSPHTFEDFSITDFKQRESVFGQGDHVRIYGQDYIKRLESSGFKVTKVNISDEFIKYGVNVDEDIFVCQK